ncbi:MAG: class I SAM-dependent methyltransferase [Candidatus Buchananbacteria bacterium]
MPNIQNGNELISGEVFSKISIEEGMMIGDLGCGNLGFFALAAAKRVGKRGIVYAVDILKSALEAVSARAKNEGLENVKTVWSNLEIFGATKIPESSLDVAFIHNMLFQSQRDDHIMKESYRLMRPGGSLMVIDWLKTGAPFGPPVGDRLNPGDVKKMALSANLNLVEEFSAGPYHFGLIFRK